jgi:salicylate hydroxylase
MGPGGHILTFPVDHGESLNLVAFVTDPDEWKDYPLLTRIGTREEALKSFAGYSRDVRTLLELCEEKLKVVSGWSLWTPKGTEVD